MVILDLLKHLIQTEKELISRNQIKSLGLKSEAVKNHVNFLTKLKQTLKFNEEKEKVFNEDFCEMILSIHSYLQFKDSDRDQLRSFQKQIQSLISKSRKINNSPNLPDTWFSSNKSKNVEIILDNLLVLEKFFNNEKKSRKKYHGKSVKNVKKLRVIGELYKFYSHVIEFKFDKYMKTKFQMEFNEMKFDNVNKSILIRFLIAETAKVFFDLKAIDPSYLSKVISKKAWSTVNPF